MDDQLLLEPRNDVPKRQDERSNEPMGSAKPELNGNDKQDMPSGSKQVVQAIEAIGTKMHTAAQHLSRRDDSFDNLSHQDTILENLDDLIAALRRKQNQRQSSKQTDSQPNKHGPDPTNPGDSTATTNPGNSIQVSGDGTKNGTENDPPSFQETMAEHWGHLPERLRTQMQSITAPEFLPQYRELIEAYYRRLAEDRNEK